MKDNVENRGRISFRSKWKTAMLALRENGPIWCGYLLAYYISSTVADRAHAKMHRLRRDHNLPGLNSAALNRHIWNSWDWSAQGDEWSASEEWKESLIRCVLEPNIRRDGSILEIGPGAGRWTASLLERARNYIGVDISSSCIEHCRKRFDNEPRAQFFVGSGLDLADVANDSIDAIWSFDVFVHINAAEVAGYMGEFVRVLRTGGVAIIHHGAVGGSGGGWRSDLTAAALEKMLVQRGLKTEKVLDQWTDGAQVQKLTFGDLITVISRPPEPLRSAS